MFLAHFSNTPLHVILEWTAGEIVYWYNEAVKEHNNLHRPPDN
jgi:hypothetical protein